MHKSIYLLLLLFTISAQAEERIITTTDGVQLYVKVEGSGIPLLYLHGGPGSGSYWFEKFFGDFVEQQFTVVYLDQRGVGRSTSPEDGNFSMERMVADFEEVREALGFETWLTVGHSFGGVLQMGYALEHPEVHQGMIMINCTLNLKESCCESWVPKAAEFVGETYPGCQTDTIALFDRMNEFGNKLREKDLFWKMAYADQKNEAIMNETFNDIKDWNYDFGNAAMSNPEFWENFKPLTAQVEMPVLFFYGTSDWMVGPEHHTDLEFPDLMLWESKGGHIPFLEDKDNLEEAILAFKEKYRS